MKKMRVVGLVIGLIGILGVGNVMAADTATINVSATVLATCTFDTTTYDMNFGDLDPGSNSDVSQTVTLNFTCGNGTSYTLDDLTGNYTMDDGGTNFLDYSVAMAATDLSGTGTGGTQSVDVVGTVKAVDFQAAAAASYSDTLTININP